MLFLIILSFLNYSGYSDEDLLMDVGGRGVGMGGAMCSVPVEDPSLSYWNPYFSKNVKNLNLLLSYRYGFSGIIKIGEIGSGYKENVLLIQYLIVPDIPITSLPDTSQPPSPDNQPYVEKFVNYYSLIANFSRPFIKSSGINLKLLYKNMSIDKSYAISIDIGLFKNIKKTNFALVLKDLLSTPIIWESGEKEYIPPKLRIGFSKNIKKILLSCDLFILPFKDYLNPFLKLGNTAFEPHVGLEINPYRNIVFIRTGLDNKNINFGFGFNYKNMAKVDLGLKTHSDLGNSYVLTLIWEFK